MTMLTGGARRGVGVLALPLGNNISGAIRVVGSASNMPRRHRLCLPQALAVYERIVVALDGSPVAERCLPHVEALAEKFGSTVILLRAILPAAQVAAVIEPSIGGVALDPDLIEDTIETEKQEARTYLEHVGKVLRGKGLKVETQIPEGSAVQAIVDCAKRLQADLIALTTHGRSGLQRLVFGSVADGVLRNAPCPVLLVRAAH
jgi:nucleotide-binding universal stress UspA family protein